MDITEDEWVDLFDSDPQKCVDLIRSKGVCFHRKISDQEEVIK